MTKREMTICSKIAIMLLAYTVLAMTKSKEFKPATNPEEMVNGDHESNPPLVIPNERFVILRTMVKVPGAMGDVAKLPPF